MPRVKYFVNASKVSFGKKKWCSLSVLQKAEEGGVNVVRERERERRTREKHTQFHTWKVQATLRANNCREDAGDDALDLSL